MEKFTSINLKVEKPRFEQLAEINASYIRWLRRIGGQNAIDMYLSHLKEILAKGPRNGDIVTVTLVDLGEGSIRFSPWTAEYPYGPIEDPINIIFKNQGRTNNVAGKLKNSLIPPWRDTATWGVQCARAHYLFIDNTSHGGISGWMKVNESLTNCGCFRRCHIRLFDGGKDTHPSGFGEYSLGSVHYEILQRFSHVVKSWDGAQQFVDSIFSSVFPFVGSKMTVRLQRQGEVLKGIQHDGMGTLIELL